MPYSLSFVVSDFYGLGVRDREDAWQDGHDELRLRRVCDGGGVRHETGAASGVFRLRRDGDIFGHYGQGHGALNS